jgi:hypothetical protein
MRVPLPAAITTTSTGFDMSTSFAIDRHARQGGAGLRRIIARALVVLGVAIALAACTTARFAYNQAPHLSHWWLDNHFDFSDTQSVQVRDEIDDFFHWHRREELPTYAGLLRQWQAMALRDVTADEICAQFEAIRGRLWHAGERVIEPFARIAPQLTNAQLENLHRRQARSNDKFERDFLRGTREQRLQRRLDTTIERSERFYGPLSREQRALLRQWLERSPWDAQRTQAERLRRQADLLQALRAAQRDPAQAEAVLRAHAERLMRSPIPDQRAHSEAAIRHGCAQLAALHNTTTPTQREQLVRALLSYEGDFHTLSAQH